MDNTSIYIWGIFVYLAIFLCNYVYYKLGYRSMFKKKKKKRNKKIEDFIGISYFVIRYKLDISKCNLNLLFGVLSLVNAFIITVVFMIINLLDWDLPFSMLLGFVLLFGLIYAMYEILGKYLDKKGMCRK